MQPKNDKSRNKKSLTTPLSCGMEGNKVPSLTALDSKEKWLEEEDQSLTTVLSSGREGKMTSLASCLDLVGRERTMV